MLGVDPALANGERGTTTTTAARRWRERVGIVLQGTGEFDELTVGEVVGHFARFYPAPDDPAEVIDRVGLTDKTKARTHTLSGGQKRRLDVALGIIGRPELLFLDEPTTGFDPEARREFWELIRDLQAGGTTIVLTTHYLDEAEALADRVGVIAGGRLIAVGHATAAGTAGFGAGDDLLAYPRWESGKARRARRRRPWSPTWPRVRRRGPRPDRHPADPGGHLPRDDRSTAMSGTGRCGARPAIRAGWRSSSSCAAASRWCSRWPSRRS